MYSCNCGAVFDHFDVITRDNGMHEPPSGHCPECDSNEYEDNDNE